MRGADLHSFLGAVRPGVYCAAKRSCNTLTSTPRFLGTVEEFAAKCAPKSPELADLCRRSLFNQVVVCPKCRKPNAYCLRQCNKCQASLEAVPTCTTPNLFTGFLLGIQSGPSFPLVLSMRRQTTDVLVFDDPLALSPLHFCAVPTKAMIPDWRYLLLCPEEGMRITELLLSSCETAAQADFLSNEEWRQSLLADQQFEVNRTTMLMGYNYPPSQNQLHLQYMLPLLLPHQYMAFLRGLHFTPQRFFPADYVEACLVALHRAGDHLTQADLQLSIEDFIDLLSKRTGVDYAQSHAQLMERAEKWQGRIARWDPANFEGRYHSELTESGESCLRFEPAGPSTKASAPKEDESVIFEREKRALHNYGRAQDTNQQSMGYYSFSRELEDLDSFFLNV